MPDNKESLEKIFETSRELENLLSFIVKHESTAESELADDPLINLANKLALEITNNLWQEVKKCKA